MVCIAHGRDDLAFDIFLANGALCAVHLLIIAHAVVDAILGEEAAGRQRLVTRDALEAALMKIFVSHP